ncbi:MAG: Trm112 family protein [Desulfovibrionaceae bacterium]|nr:Trm112 family protein [Desulfovibrionaceae bacterium]
MSIDKELLEILACPKCKGPLVPTDDGEGLKCEADQLVYPIREDIPVMLVDEAVPAAAWATGIRSV